VISLDFFNFAIPLILTFINFNLGVFYDKMEKITCFTVEWGWMPNEHAKILFSDSEHLFNC